MKNIVILFLFLLLNYSCSVSKTSLSKIDKEKYGIYFNKDAIKPLKKELPELYKILKNDGVYYCHSCNENSPNFVWSEMLATYFREHKKEILNSTFLNNKSNFLVTLGIPNEEFLNNKNNVFELHYLYPIIGSSCVQCTDYNGVGLTIFFDNNTGKIIHY